MTVPDKPIPNMDQDTLHRLMQLDTNARLMQARERAGLDRHKPHDAELVATLGEVDFINDSRSTFLDATLRTMSELQRPLVWIAGAQAADIGAAHVQDFLKRRVVAVVFFGKADEARVEALRAVIEDVYMTGDVRTATFLARELATEGKAVLFSPACPSGDGFANYEERGMEFKRAVKDL
jgi:UDP-N-acetylmuramoylalanine--D-glutamate ligase